MKFRTGNSMTLEECIEEILSEFTSGDYFDSHTIINEMQRNHKWHSVYMQNYPENSTVAQYHGIIIAKKIGESQNVGPANLKIKTHTIYGDLVPNQVWKKN